MGKLVSYPSNFLFEFKTRLSVGIDITVSIYPNTVNGDSGRLTGRSWSSIETFQFQEASFKVPIGQHR